jgi:S1-C subfamily serine protease
MTAWAAAAGLRRGDRPVAYGGTRVTGIEDADNEVWARVAHGEYVDVRVDRTGKEVSLRIPCRDDHQRWEAYIALGQTIVEGRWQDCVDAVSRMVKALGYAPAATLNTAILCLREKSVAERQRPPDDYWRRIHAWATKAIEESRYRPTGLAEIRTRLVSATETLEKAGQNTLADDIKQQIARFSQTPATSTPAEIKTGIQQVGTAFVVRPDGYLLTAFHVVKGAKEIEVSCRETGNVATWVERFSEANDLAVLRVADGKTPTYLSLADQRSVNLGEQVFTIGYPARDILGGEAKFNEGTISSLSVGGDAGYMQISVPVHPGNSGGALLNRSGDVVGVVIATASALNFLKGTGTLPQNVSWAVKGAFAVPLFDAPPPSPRMADRNSVVRRAVTATCSVTASTVPDSALITPPPATAPSSATAPPFASERQSRFIPLKEVAWDDPQLTADTRTCAANHAKYPEPGQYPNYVADCLRGKGWVSKVMDDGHWHVFKVVCPPGQHFNPATYREADGAARYGRCE